LFVRCGAGIVLSVSTLVKGYAKYRLCLQLAAFICCLAA
jgi:hypothetical protein